MSSTYFNENSFPILDNPKFANLPNLQQNLSVTANNSSKIWLIIVMVVVVLILGLAGYYFWYYRSKETKNKTKGKRYTHGHLKTSNGFINIGPRIFPKNPGNLSNFLVLEDKPQTIWIQELDEDQTFILKTEANGIIFSIQKNPPGAGAEWGVAYAAPMFASEKQNVIFTSKFHATEGVWSENDVYLKTSDNHDNNFLFWDPDSKKSIKKLKMV